MPFQPVATADISWLSLEEGGREKPPSGTIYAATAKFAELSDEFFSVVLRPFNPQSPGQDKENAEVHWLRLTAFPKKYDLDFFAPELVADRLSPGTKLWLTEGQRTVAQGEIMSVDTALINKIRSESKSRV
jgi:hypothetical protein